MALSSTTTKLQYNGDGSTASFTVSFNFWDVDDLRVILTDSSDEETVWTRGTEYTITRDIATGATTGTLNVVTTPTDYTPASGERLTIKSNLSDIQDEELPSGGSFPSAAVEQRLDKNVRLTQQLAEEMTRVMKYDEGESATFGDYPGISDRAGKFLKWGSDGLPTAAAGTNSALDAPDFTSSEQTVTALTKLDVAHSLGAKPTLVQVTLRCKTTDLGYAVGDEVIWSGHISGDHGAQVMYDATNVSIIQGTDIYLLKKALFDTGTITVGSWRWIVKAWA